MSFIEEFSISEHGTSDAEQMVGYRAQGTTVGVAAATQGVITGAADRIMLHRYPSPVIHGIAQAAIAKPDAVDFYGRYGFIPTDVSAGYPLLGASRWSCSSPRPRSNTWLTASMTKTRNQDDCDNESSET